MGERWHLGHSHLRHAREAHGHPTCHLLVRLGER
jgi:hypothetical protein